MISEGSVEYLALVPLFASGGIGQLVKSGRSDEIFS